MQISCHWFWNYIYIYMYVCVHTLFLHAVVHVDESSSVFSISSPGDFISFPHLFDHFIKRIWSVLISLSQKMFPTYFFILLFGSSAVPSFPNLFLQLIITVCLQFSKVFPTYWCMLSLGFISFSHLFLEFIMMFHEFWLSVPSLYH